jgi:Mrp family chromosome partitioning ATPase
VKTVHRVSRPSQSVFSLSVPGRRIVRRSRRPAGQQSTAFNACAPFRICTRVSTAPARPVHIRIFPGQVGNARVRARESIFRPMRAFKAIVHAFHVFKSEPETTKMLTEDLERSSPRRPRNFHEYLMNLADGLPWFGEEPFFAAPEPTPPGPIRLSPPYVRRILLAFLAGRPIAVAAGRAGCSPRTLYGIINRVVYGSWPEELHQLWFYLGLIAIVDYDDEEERPPPDNRLYGTLERVVDEYEALLFCLVCHRFLMPVESQRSTIPQMLEDGALFPQVVNYGDLGHVQGHLAVLMVELIDQRANWPKQVVASTGFSAIGRLRNRKKQDEPEYMVRREDATGGESFCMAKTRLVAALGASELGHSLLVASPRAGEGKTVVLANLADALSEDGASVVVVSSDLRSASCIDDMWHAPVNAPGLSDFLVDGSINPQHVTIDTERIGVHLIPRGTLRDDARSLIDSTRMSQLIGQLKESYDWVLLDSPGTLDTADAARLSGLVDSTLVVVDGTRTSLTAVNDTFSMLEGAGARIVGFFHNRYRADPVASMLGKSLG